MVPWRSFFGPVRFKKLSTKPWRFPLFCLKIFDSRILSKHRRVLLRILSAVWAKNFSTDFSDTPSYAQIFAIHEFSRNTELFPNENFWYCVTNVFDGETWYPLPLWCIKIFDSPNFLKHWRDAHGNFRHCETKKFRHKIVT